MTVDPAKELIDAEVDQHGVYVRRIFDQHVAAGNKPAEALANALASINRSAPTWLIRAVADEAELDDDQRTAYETALAESGPDNAAAALQLALATTTEGDHA